MIAEGFVFKSGVVAMSGITLLATATGLTDALNSTTVNWEKLGIIGVMGCGLLVLSKLLFKIYEDKERIYEERIKEAKEHEQAYVNVLKETNKALQDLAAIIRALDVHPRRGEGT